MMDNSLTTDAGSDLILLSKGQRNPSKEYTLIWWVQFTEKKSIGYTQIG